MKKLRVYTLFLLSFFIIESCQFSKQEKTSQRSTIFIGIDVSGSFTRTKMFKNGMKFLGEYIHAHLKGLNNLSKPVDLYVGGIGGNIKEDPQDFFPIHDFQGLSPQGIESKLVKEFAGQKDQLTDFNTYFHRIKSIVKQKNLVLAPLNVILITDGVPEIQGRTKTAIKQGYNKINLAPIEYLTRNTTIRILYASPRVGNNWRNYVPTKRIKVWTIEPRVMYGWIDQKKRFGDKGLHKWILDNVDLRVNSKGL